MKPTRSLSLCWLAALSLTGAALASGCDQPQPPPAQDAATPEDLAAPVEDLAAPPGEDLAARPLADLALAGSDAAAQGNCVRNGWANWCKQPSPATARLTRVHGLNDQLVMVVGLQGTILRYDGVRWTKEVSGTMAELRSVWVASPTLAWAVGKGGVALRWDGSAWTPVPTGVTTDLLGVYVASANDVWVVTGDGTMRWNGAAWTTTRQAFACWDIWGSGPNEVWVASQGTSLGVGMLVGYAARRWDGSNWNAEVRIPIKSSGGMNYITGAGPGQVWMAGKGDTAGLGTLPVGGIYWGTLQPSFGSDSRNEYYLAIWASSANDIWVSGSSPLPGLVYHGTRGAPVPPRPGYNPVDIGTTAKIVSLWGTSRDSVWAVGGTDIVHLEP